MPVYSRPLPDAAADPFSPEYYARMAIWATEASAADIERFWRDTALPPNYVRGAPSLDDVLLARWVVLDPEGAIRVFGNETIGSGPAWTAWARHDPDKALAAARASGRKRSIEWVIKGIAGNNPERALEIVGKDPSLAPFVISTITANYAKEGKYHQALDLKLKYGTYNVTAELRLWAKEDPHAAMRWCLERPYAGEINRDAVYETFLAEYPDQANELIAILPDAETKREFGEKRLEQLLAKDPKLAASFARSQQDPETRNALTLSLGTKLAKTDWETAAVLYKEFAANNGRLTYGGVCIYIDEKNHTSVHQPIPSEDLLRSLSSERPTEAFDLVSSIATDRNRAELLDSVVVSWITRDRYGFSEFLAAQPPSPARDQWTERLSSSLTSHADPARNDYPSSIEWALSIRDAGLKDKTLGSTIEDWREKDSSGLDGYLKDTRIPQANREAVKRLLTSAPNE